MAATIPEKFVELVTEKVAFAVLGTVMPDGSPQTTPIWFDYRDGRIRINTAQGRRKERNLNADPRVALAIMDPSNPYRYLQVRGRVVKRVVGEEAEVHIDALAKKYLNQERYPLRRSGETRITYEIAIDSCQTMG